MTDASSAAATTASRSAAAPCPAAAPAPVSAVHMLADAKRLIDGDADLSALNHRIVRAACEVSGARYAGLVLLGVDGEVVSYAHHGLTNAQVEAARELIGPVSRGRGSAAARVDELSVAGLRCFRVSARGEQVAELYLPRSATLLTDGVAADGTPAEDILRGLVAMIGGTLDAANLQADADRSKDWLAASGMIARSLLDGGSTAETWNDIVSSALRVAEADYASLVLPRSDGLLEVAVAVGVGADDYRGFLLDPLLSRLASAVSQGEGMVVSDLNEIMRAGFDNVHGFGPLMMAPLVDAMGVRGSIVLARSARRKPFTARDLDLARTFADQVALALEMDDARARCSWLSVLEDRHRIARDLHDNVMQRLFAAGVGLQSLAASQLPPDIAVRLRRYVDDLDETIDEIRERVFGLRDHDADGPGLTPTRFPRLAAGPGL